ncbi:hypothetical protein K239x_01420 [Planctomycetes bacterium K23_9]|uniref:Uncharacterized protein n=1 Tax=Stieleria marina TaxID=1930275 RepID=A0A517NM98_9BACT|nr:hypothetical protein K239x_01420 [Planctomycetes bacterium K23_9]
MVVLVDQLLVLARSVLPAVCSGSFGAFSSTRLHQWIIE